MTVEHTAGPTIEGLIGACEDFKSTQLTMDIAKAAAPRATEAYLAWYAAKQTPYGQPWRPNAGHSRVPSLIDSGAAMSATFRAVGQKIILSLPHYMRFHEDRQNVLPGVEIPPAIATVVDDACLEVCDRVVAARGLT